ncbi:DUF7331 family protein [Halomicrobium urmianum]|uniref:DUF7331 family protein n=1 Tax=Halomicrobium urmianum TaxID=1586233 RepID=UPI00402B2158
MAERVIRSGPSRTSTDRSMTDQDQTADDQYGAFTTGGGDTIVYDRRNPEAWIQSDYSVSVGPDEEAEA